MSLLQLPQIGGPLTIGSHLTAALYAVSVQQTYTYFKTFRTKDPWKLQLLVIFLLSLNTAQFLLTIAVNWLAITNRFLTDETLLLKILALCYSVTILLAQAYFAERCYKLTRKPLLAILMGLGLCVQFTASVLSSSLLLKSTDSLVRHSGWVHDNFVIWLTMSAINEVSITGLLTICLLRARKTCLFIETGLVFQRIVRSAIATAVFPLLLTIMIILTSTLPQSQIQSVSLTLIPSGLLPLVLSLSVLFTLHYRSHLRAVIHSNRTLDLRIEQVELSKKRWFSRPSRTPSESSVSTSNTTQILPNVEPLTGLTTVPSTLWQPRYPPNSWQPEQNIERLN